MVGGITYAADMGTFLVAATGLEVDDVVLGMADSEECCDHEDGDFVQHCGRQKRSELKNRLDCVLVASRSRWGDRK